MVDAHHVPPELQNLLLITTGNRWPTGDEEALRLEAEAWRQAAKVLGSVSEQVEIVRALVRTALSGATRDKADAFHAQLIGGSGVAENKTVLPALIEAAESGAEALEEEALQIETLRIEIIGALVVLFLQLIIDAAVWLFGGAEKAAEDIVATRVLCMNFLRQAVAHVLTRLAESVTAMVGMALLAQIIELRQKNPNGERRRKTLDGNELRVAAVNGAIGAPVGFGMGLVGGAATAGLKNLAKKPFLTNLPNKMQSLTRFGVGLGFHAGFGALTGMAEQEAQNSAFGLSGFEAGAANGVFNRVHGVRHETLNPHGLFALSPAEHAERYIDRYLARRNNKAPGGMSPPPAPLPGQSFPDMESDGDSVGLGRGESFLDLSSDGPQDVPGRGFLDTESDGGSTTPGRGESVSPGTLEEHALNVLHPTRE